LEKESAVAYLVRLAGWAKGIGLIRDEIRLGSKWFNETELRSAENWQSDTAERLFEQQSEIQSVKVHRLGREGE